MPDTHDHDNTLGEYRWECPYRDCKFFLLQYTPENFEEKKRTHLDHHLDKMKAEREEREKKLKAAEEKRKQDGLKLYKDEIQVSKKDINKLVLTLYDISQFETHGIKIDEDCVIDGYSNQPPVSES